MKCEYYEALGSFMKALDISKNNEFMQMTLLSNISQCYIKLYMYEDALEYSEKALDIRGNHSKSLYRKAISLAYLFRFDESRLVLK